MTDLCWPGAERAGPVLDDGALLTAMVRVEAAWLRVLVAAGFVAAAAADPLDGLLGRTAEDLGTVAAAAEGAGNPVPALVGLLRTRVASRNPAASAALHRGLTSQDVLDTALVLGLREAADTVLATVGRQARVLHELADRYRAAVQPGRTLTQYAVPTTFGLTAAGWLTGVLDAADGLASARDALPVQVGGAAGTLAAVAELARIAGAGDPAARAMALAGHLAAELGLRAAPPWHTNRRPMTRLADALVACTDAWGRIANDVLVRVRPEIGELAEPVAAGRGGSSTMPHKRNPVLSVLIRRAALTAPGLGAHLHTASAGAVDERPDGAWHSEWAALRTLGRTAVVAGSQTAELLDGLTVHADRMRVHAEAARADLLAEQRSLADPAVAPAGADGPPDTYLGCTGLLIDAARERADRYLKEHP